MSQLWRVEVEETKSTTVYVLAETQEEAERTARENVDSTDLEFECGDINTWAKPTTEDKVPRGEEVILPDGKRRDIEEMTADKAEAYAAALSTPGTAAFQAAAEAAGQRRLRL